MPKQQDYKRRGMKIFWENSLTTAQSGNCFSSL